MSRVKLEHYVPQSYLRNFSNKKDQVFVYDKGLKKHFISNTRNVAAESKYFHLDKNGEDDAIINLMNEDQVIEKFFSTEIEGKFKSLLNNIVTRAKMTYEPSLKLAITKEEKVDLSYYLAIQMLRTKDFRQTISDTSEKLLRAMYDHKNNLSSKMNSFLNDIKNTDLKSIQAGMLFDSQVTNNISDAILKHIWVIYINKTDDKFITSDNPIVRNGNVPNPILSNTGLSSLGVEIAFPISADLLLVMYERKFHTEFEICDERFIVLNEKDVVMHYNTLQIYHCHNQVYSLSDLKFFIKTIAFKDFFIIKQRSKVDLHYKGKKY